MTMDGNNRALIENHDETFPGGAEIMKRFAWILFLPLFFCQKITTRPPDFITPEEYKIYQCVAEYLDNETGLDVILVHDSTLVNCPDPGHYDETARGVYLPPAFGGPESAWPKQGFNRKYFEENFPERNRLRLKISGDSIKTGKAWVRTIPWSGLEDTRSPESNSPEKTGFLWFSRVVFNLSGIEALVYADFTCGGRFGAGSWYWIRKTNGIWIVHQSANAWVS
jgi:hypothetical protein